LGDEQELGLAKGLLRFRGGVWVALLVLIAAMQGFGQSAATLAAKKKAAVKSSAAHGRTHTAHGKIPVKSRSAEGRSVRSGAKAKSSGSHRTASKATGKTRVVSRRHAAFAKVYRTGHGNHGLGTTKAAPRYTAPLPSVAEEIAPVRPPVAGAGAVEFADNLDGFFARLQAIENGDRTQTTRILQFGDSHTAADMMTGRMRSLMQARFGDGGAGFSYAGHPFAGYRILGTSRAQSAGWVTEGVHFSKIQDTQLGLGGVANTSTRAGETVELDAPCQTMEVQYLDQPGGGSFSLLEDGQTVKNVSTDSGPTGLGPGPETLTTECAPGVDHHFEVVSESSAPVRLLGFVTEQPGITYEAIGLNGAEAALMTRWDQAMFATYLKQRDPALIVLAYGTNEASDHNWTYAAYRNLMSDLVDQLHATVPKASILVIGPPDRSIRAGRAGRRHGYSWTTYDETVHITDAQRETCRTHGCAFWSWRDRMGGLGSMNAWATDGLAQGDHTHFTSRGYVELADDLYSDIIAAYTTWKTANPAADPIARGGTSSATSTSPNP
jgi:lysophospholipase L1-like esterase